MLGLENLTPVMRQYHTFKSQHQDSILFFRMGDFYEAFYEDAKTCSRILGITLTSRNKGDTPIPMAGVPYHSVDGYIQKLIQAGYYVAICDQVQDAREAKGLIDRDVTRIITPGTVTEEALLESKRSSYLASVLIEKGMTGLAWVELSTGKFLVEEISSARLGDELARIEPAECLVREGAFEGLPVGGQLRSPPPAPTPPAPPQAIAAVPPGGHEAGSWTLTAGAITRRPDYVFDYATAYRALTEHFRTQSLAGFGCDELTLGIGAAGALIDYLNETQKTSLQHINQIQRYRSSGHLLLDQSTQRSLELVEALRGGREGALLSVLDRTRTGMGGRLLRDWLLSPLTDMDGIARRLGAVQELRDSPFRRQDLQELLQGMYDVERIAGKVSCRRANARDLVSLKRSAALLPPLRAKLGGSVSEILGELSEHLDTLPEIHALLQKAIVEEPPATINDGGLIAQGYHAELDELLSISKDGQSWLARYQAEEIQRAGIPSLKVGYNQVFGYYVEVTHTHTDKVPPGYQRKQTLKNAERYITPELKEFESRVLTAEEKSRDLEYQIFVAVRDEVASHIPRIQRVAEQVALLDVFCSLAEVAARNGYCRPELSEDLTLQIQDGRHPVIEQALGTGKFIPNDVLLDGDHNQLLILTGPNMAGKSTYLRQVALITLMAQMGSFVPARQARIGLVDRIFTRVGAADDLTRGQSTFMVEMNETANILNNATDRSLLILDEIGRGTSTFDGVSIAWAVCEYLSERLRPRTLFATHYHELTALTFLIPTAKNYSVAVREWGDEILFLRKIVEGGTDKSYGIHVARLAGIPREVIERAQVILGNLEAQSVDPTGKPKFAPPRVRAKKPKEMQLLMFGSPHEEVIHALRDLQVDTLSPLQALMKLKELQDAVRKIDQP